MKIALISEHASPLADLGGIDSGGQNVYVGQVAAQLARRGHQVDVFTRRDRPGQPPVVPLPANAADAENTRVGRVVRVVRVVHIPAGPPEFVAKERLLPHIAEFADGIAARCAHAQRPYDVVHANFFMSGIAALHLRRAFGTPFVITFHALGKVRRQHQGTADGFPAERTAIEEMLVAEADRIVAECPQDRDDLMRLYAADPARIDIAPCGFDPGELGPGGGRHLRRSLGLADDEFVILQLGRLVPRKGIDNVIRALAALRRDYGLKARLLIVGGDSDSPDPALTPEIGRLAAIAASEGVAGQVLFTGRQPRRRLRDFYGAADVFVTTPWYEPFGITPLEAMACGCPVVGAAVGGIKYSVVDAVTGYLVPPHDPAALAARLAQLAADPELRRALGHAGMRRVGAHFTWGRVADALLHIYGAVQQALAPPPRAFAAGPAGLRAGAAAASVAGS